MLFFFFQWIPVEFKSCDIVATFTQKCWVDRIQVISFFLHLTESFWIYYCQTFNISHSLVGNKIVDHSDVVGG